MSRNFTKHGAFKATDSDRQIAVGAALVPDAVDRQGDWFRGDTITALADDYMARLPDGEAEQGVMHVKFEDDDITLVENRVLDESETIGDDEFAAGTWILGYQIHDDSLWQLVDDEILAGFSIGGQIPEDGESKQPVADLPDDVSVPDSADVGTDDDGNATVAEITEAAVHEVSLVDVPAVPDATVSMMKAAREVAKDGSLTDPERAEQALRNRGHSEDDAALLAGYLTKAAPFVEKPFAGFDDFDDCVATMQDEQDYDEETAEQVCGRLQEEHEDDDSDKTDDAMSTDDTDDTSTDLQDVEDATLGKRLKRLLLGDPDAADKDGATDTDDGDDAALPEVSGGDAAKALHIAKEGRSLNEDNRAALMAAHDAIETALESDLDFTTNRFSENSGVDFEAGEYGSDKAVDAPDFEGHLEKLTDAQVALVREAIQQFVDSQGDADVGSLQEWLWNHDEAEDIDADVLTALDVALDDFREAQAPRNQQVTGTFADWVSNQGDTTEINFMTDDDDTTDDADGTDSTKTDAEPPAWAKTLVDDVEAIDERVAEMEDGTEKDLDDAPEWAQDLAEKVGDLNERVDAVSKATAGTTQAGGDETTDETDDEGDAFLKALGS